MPINKNSSKRFVFPPKEEFERVVKRAQRSDRRTNIGLTPWATELDKAKYKLCKSILRYKRQNDLTTKDIAKQLGLSIYRAEYILYSHIDKLTLDELITYAESLHAPFELRNSYENQETAQEAH
ncbi:hypothetical protein [endosymbiont GvMRE of Glomus versiforme]|uniref:hypothetical protein n=1 Tax=endosymbiont GvMRE of Glomus versiforme TaxID=2039283 RepID=UPI000ED29F78|nr:hypothetical protein [endosymbiont GvMRE of Glomus versiforme]RHZ36544.1 XRE family transcriptional regulator [endosymbiont GvMRE of Glomus versiforme]